MALEVQIEKKLADFSLDVSFRAEANAARMQSSAGPVSPSFSSDDPFASSAGSAARAGVHETGSARSGRSGSEYADHHEHACQEENQKTLP